MSGLDSYGTGPGNYFGYGGSQHMNGADALLSPLSHSAQVNSIDIPYAGSAYDVGKKLLQDGNMTAFNTLISRYGGLL